MIPKIIHYCWFGSGDMPEKDKKNIEGWKKLCPDYEIVRWDESNYDIHKNKYMDESYSIPKWGFVPDYARTDIVYTYGGFYFDTDVELLKPFDELLNESCIMGFEKKDSINHGHGFAAEKGHPVLKSLLEFYDKIHFINEDGTLNMTASPVYITELMVSKGLKLNGKEQIIDDIHVYPVEYFCPKNYVTGKVELTKNTISIHHFNLSWMNQDEIDRMNEIGKYSRYFGEFIGRNIVDFRKSIKNQGLFGPFIIFIKKLNKKISNKN